MNMHEIAKKLGQRGGRVRAARLNAARRKDIARQGAVARLESIRIAKSIHHNFRYVEAMYALNPPPLVVSESIS